MAEKIFPATDEALAQVNQYVEECLEAAGCSMKNQMKIMVALEELFINVAHYAYPAGEKGTVAIDLSFHDDVMRMTLKDSGIPFDPLAKEDPDITLSAGERKIGGLGIYMVKKTMDTVSYVYENGQNILTITHRIK